MKKLILPLATALILAGCGSDNDEVETTASETAQDAAAAPARDTAPEMESRRDVRRSRDQEITPQLAEPEEPARSVPRMQGSAETDGYGLTMIVDGSSTAAFEQSLELIAEDTTAEQYRQLDAAIRYLRAYSSSAWGDLENLYATLDGKTGEEIIEEATQLRERRSRR